MATLLIDIHDVTTQAVRGDTITLTAPALRPGEAGFVTRPYRRLVELDGLGMATVEVEPGPLRVIFHNDYGREVVIDTRVPDVGDTFTLRELIVAYIGHPEDVTGISEALAGKADKTHQHTTADIEELDEALDSLRTVLDSAVPAEHSHAISDVRKLQDALDGKADEIHSHAISDVRELQDVLDGKAPKAHNHTIAEIKDLIWSLDQKVSITDLAESTRRYSSEKIAELVDGAPESLDTLREVAEEFKKQDKAVQAVFAELAKRAMKSHTHSIEHVTGLRSELDTRPNAWVVLTAASVDAVAAKGREGDVIFSIDTRQFWEVY